MGVVMALAAPTRPPGAPASIQECIDALTHFRLVRGHSARTIALDTWILGALPCVPQEVTLADLETIVMRNRNASSRSTYASRLHSIFAALRQMQLIDTTVDAMLARLKAPAGQPRPLSDEQVDALLTELPTHMADVVRCGILAGTRAMEVWAMRGDDLSHGHRGAELLLHGKGGRDVAIPCHPRLVQMINDYETLGRLWTRWSSPAVLSSAMSKKMGEILKDESVTYHQCRHTFGTRVMRASDNDVLLASSLLRHESLKSSMVYIKLADDRPRMAIDRLAG